MSFTLERTEGYIPYNILLQSYFYVNKKGKIYVFLTHYHGLFYLHSGFAFRNYIYQNGKSFHRAL